MDGCATQSLSDSNSDCSKALRFHHPSFPIPLAAMSSQTNNLSEIIKTSEGVLAFLGRFCAEGKISSCQRSHLATISIPPLQLPSVDSVLSNFKSSFPAELLDRLASILTKSIGVIRHHYENSYRALYSSTQPTQDQNAYKLRCAYESLYQFTVVSRIQNFLTTSNQKAARSHPETRDSVEPKPKLRTRFRQVSDRIVHRGLFLSTLLRNMFHSLNSTSNQMHTHLILKEHTWLERRKCPIVK